LSHGHYDHFGDLAGLLQHHSGKLKAKLPIYIGGEQLIDPLEVRLCRGDAVI
jgi:7,8-dihydropterin-6-yl-methyl-4-(beta-D-ribofuranosyl)aminobenzene 5'-phosphate synthase